MFTQKCFIRKNTPELVKKLEALGYKALFSARYNYGIHLYCMKNLVLSVDSAINEEEGFINCEENEPLFLAIASLRDDTDNMQWFVNKDRNFIFCDQNELKHVIDNSDEYMDYCVADFHKATVQELIDHFKI